MCNKVHSNTQKELLTLTEEACVCHAMSCTHPTEYKLCYFFAWEEPAWLERSSWLLLKHIQEYCLPFHFLKPLLCGKIILKYWKDWKRTRHSPAQHVLTWDLQVKFLVRLDYSRVCEVYCEPANIFMSIDGDPQISWSHVRRGKSKQLQEHNYKTTTTHSLETRFRIMLPLNNCSGVPCGHSHWSAWEHNEAWG